MNDEFEFINRAFELIKSSEFISSKMNDMNDKLLKMYENEIQYMKDVYGDNVHICTSFDSDLRKIPKIFEDNFMSSYKGRGIISFLEFIKENPEYEFFYWKKIFKCIKPRIFFVIRYNNVTVSNEEGESAYLGDLMCTFYIQDNMIPYKHPEGYKRDLKVSNLYMTRISYSPEHFATSFVHPHCKPLSLNINKIYFSHCCLGRGPLSELIMNFNSEIIIDTYELVMLYSANIDSFVNVESLKGGPYIKISSVKSYSFSANEYNMQRYIVDHFVSSSSISNNVWIFISKYPTLIYMFIDNIMSRKILRPEIVSSNHRNIFDNTTTFLKIKNLDNEMLIELSKIFNDCLMCYCMSLNIDHNSIIPDALLGGIVIKAVVRDGMVYRITDTKSNIDKIIEIINKNNGSEIILFNNESVRLNIPIPEIKNNDIKFTYILSNTFAYSMMYNISKMYI